MKKVILDEGRDLSGKKEKSLNPKLLVFDSKVQAFREGTLSLSVFGRFLSEQLSQIEAGSFHPQVETFLEAAQLEGKIDFKQVEKERTQLLSRLITSLDEKKLADLYDCSLAYRLGHLGHSDFYRYLRNLCEKSGVSLTRASAMNHYIQYILLADSVNSDSLQSELDQMEGMVYRKLIQNPLEQRLIDRSKRLYLANKLIDLALTPKEWTEYNKFQLKNNKSLNPQYFEDFYKKAEARDEVIVYNLMAQMKAHAAKTAVLVAGGFHNLGVTNRLQKEGFTIINFSPKITKIESDQGPTYLSVFTQEKTPLEKLFEGEKLFLPKLMEQTPASNRFTGAVLALADAWHGMSLQKALRYHAPHLSGAVLSRTPHSLLLDLRPTSPNGRGQKGHRVRFDVAGGRIGGLELERDVEQVPGSITGHFIFDSFWEVLFFISVPLMTLLSYGVVPIEGITDPKILTLIHLAFGLVFGLLLSFTVGSIYIVLHGEKSFEAYRALAPFNPLSFFKYKQEIKKLFERLNLRAGLVFVGAILFLLYVYPSLPSGEIVNLIQTLLRTLGGQNSPTGIFWLASLTSAGFNVLDHLRNNLLFKLGFLCLAPVPGSTTAKTLEYQPRTGLTVAFESLPPRDQVLHFRELVDRGEDVEMNQGHLRTAVARLGVAVRESINPILQGLLKTDYSMRAHSRDKKRDELLIEEFLRKLDGIMSNNQQSLRLTFGFSGTNGGGRNTYAFISAEHARRTHPERIVQEIDLHDFTLPTHLASQESKDPFARFDMEGLLKFLRDLHENKYAYHPLFDPTTQARIQIGLDGEGNLVVYNGSQGVIIDREQKGPQDTRTHMLGQTPIQWTIQQDESISLKIRNVTLPWLNNRDGMKINMGGEEKTLKRGEKIEVLRCVEPANADPGHGIVGDAIYVRGNATLLSDAFHASANVNSSARIRARRESRQQLALGRRDAERVESDIQAILDHQVTVDPIIDSLNNSVRDRRGYDPANSKKGGNHFQISGLRTSDSLFRLLIYNDLLEPGMIEAFSEEFGIPLPWLAKTVSALGESVRVDWVGSLNEQKKGSPNPFFTHPLSAHAESGLMADLEDLERFWAGTYATLSVGRRNLIKFIPDEGRAPTDKDGKTYQSVDIVHDKAGLGDRISRLTDVLERGMGVIAPAQILNLFGVLFPPFLYEALEMEGGELKKNKHAVKSISEALMVRQLPFMEDVLNELANEGESGLEEGNRHIDSFFVGQKTLFTRAQADNAPDITHRYGLEAQHRGGEVVLGLAFGSLTVDKEGSPQASSVIKKIAEEQNKLSYPGALDQEGCEDLLSRLKGYQRQYIWNYENGEIYFNRIPKPFRRHFLEKLIKNIPQDETQLEGFGWGTAWNPRWHGAEYNPLRTPGVTSVTADDVMMSRIEEYISGHFLDRMRADFNKHYRPIADQQRDTPQLAAASLFLHWLPLDPAQGLRVMAEYLNQKVFSNPKWLEIEKGIRGNNQDTVAHLYNEIRDAIPNQTLDGSPIIRRNWEELLFLAFLNWIVELPYEWRDITTQSKTAELKAGVHPAVIIPKEGESDYHKSLGEEHLQGKLRLPLRPMERKAKPTDALLNLHPDPKHNPPGQDGGTVNKYFQFALEQLKAGRKKILILIPVAGSASRMMKGDIAKLALEALFEDPHRFIDKKKLTEGERNAVNGQPGTDEKEKFTMYIQVQVERARYIYGETGTDSPAEKKRKMEEARKVGERLKRLIYSPKALWPCAKVDGRWYNFNEFNLKSIAKANKELKEAGYGEPLIPGLMSNAEFDEVILQDLENNDYYGVSKELTLRYMFYQPLGYAVAATPEDVEALDRDERDKLAKGELSPEQASFKTREDYDYATGFSEENKGRVTYGLGLKPEGHGWVYPTLLLKENGIKEPPIVLWNREGITDVLMHNVDTMMQLDDHVLTTLGLKWERNLLTIMEGSESGATEKGKGGGFLVINMTSEIAKRISELTGEVISEDLIGKRFVIQAEWDVIQKAAEALSLDLNDPEISPLGSPHNNATLYNSPDEAFELLLGEDYKRAKGIPIPEERDAALAALIPKLARGISFVPIARAEKTADQNGVMRNIVRVIFELRAWEIQQADLSRGGFTYTQGAVEITDEALANKPEEEKVEAVKHVQFNSLKTQDIYDLDTNPDPAKRQNVQQVRTLVFARVVKPQYKLFNLPPRPAVAAAITGHPKADPLWEWVFHLIWLVGSMGFVWFMTGLAPEALSDRTWAIVLATSALLASLVIKGLTQPIAGRIFARFHGDKALKFVQDQLNQNTAGLRPPRDVKELRDLLRTKIFPAFDHFTFGVFLGAAFILGPILTFWMGPALSVAWAVTLAVPISLVANVVRHLGFNLQFLEGKASLADLLEHGMGINDLFYAVGVWWKTIQIPRPLNPLVSRIQQNMDGRLPVGSWGLRRVTGTIIQKSNSDGTVTEGEAKVIQVSNPGNVDKLLRPNFELLNAHLEKKRATIVLIDPDDMSTEGEIVKAIRALNLDLNEVGEKITFLSARDPRYAASIKRGGFNSINGVLAAAFDGKDSSHLPGLPKNRIRGFQATLSIIKTQRNWNQVTTEFVDLGGFKIPLNQIVAFFVELLTGSARIVPINDRIENLKATNDKA